MSLKKNNRPALYTILSPSLRERYDLSDSIVVIIDILRATSTIATALHNGAKAIIPVDSVAECIKLGKQLDVITPAVITSNCLPNFIHSATLSTGIIAFAPLCNAVAIVEVARKISMITTML